MSDDKPKYIESEVSDVYITAPGVLQLYNVQWVLDTDKIKTVKDIKAVLKSMDIALHNITPTDDALHLFKKVGG